MFVRVGNIVLNLDKYSWFEARKTYVNNNIQFYDLFGSLQDTAIAKDMKPSEVEDFFDAITEKKGG